MLIGVVICLVAKKSEQMSVTLFIRNLLELSAVIPKF